MNEFYKEISRRPPLFSTGVTFARNGIKCPFWSPKLAAGGDNYSTDHNFTARYCQYLALKMAIPKLSPPDASFVNQKERNFQLITAA
jgi:hypothetical protein